MAADKLLLEDSSGGYQLEDASGVILLTPVNIPVTGLSSTGTLGTATFALALPITGLQSVGTVGTIGTTGGDAAAPTTPTVAEQPAGRKKRTRWVVRIDGEDFEVASLAAALELLAQAKALALQHAQEVARAATDKPAKPQELAKRVRIPVVSGEGPGLPGAAEEAQAMIRQTYEGALRDAEIAMYFEMAERKEKMKRERDDEEDTLMMLMW